MTYYTDDNLKNFSIEKARLSGIINGGLVYWPQLPFSSFCGSNSNDSSNVVNTNAQRRFERLEQERAAVYNILKARALRTR